MKKATRALTRLPDLDRGLSRRFYRRDAASFTPKQPVHAIITSPPYMRNLDYGRDNRLRLWFLGVPDWASLDHSISPTETAFLRLMRACLRRWRDVLTPAGICVVVLGDNICRQYGLPLPDAVAKVATKEVGGYSVVSQETDPIPNERRSRRNCRGNLSETVLVLRKEKGH